MAFIRYKGPYAYLVENERLRRGGRSYVRQRVLFYLGRDPKIDDGIIAEVGRRFPEVTIDWPALRAQLGGERPTPTRRRRPPRAAKPEPPPDDDWLDWD